MGLWLHNHVGVNLSSFAQWSGRDLDIKKVMCDLLSYHYMGDHVGHHF